MPFDSEVEVGLTGLNCTKAQKPKEIILGNDGPFAIRNDLGWVITGKLDGILADESLMVFWQMKMCVYVVKMRRQLISS